MAQVTELFRHPIKALGREALTSVTLEPGKCMPWDRHWALAHVDAKLEDGWSRCGNFTRGASSPKLMAMTAVLNEADASVTLSHPDRKDFTFQPSDDRQLSGLLAWIKPLIAENRSQASHIVAAPDRGMTDSPFPSISLNNHASRRALSQKLGQDLSLHRFRGNIWVDGFGPWEEHEWDGKRLQIGNVILEGKGIIDRCKATMANPDTGNRDADTLGALQDGWGHIDFGQFLTVVQGGVINVGDEVTVIQ